MVGLGKGKRDDPRNNTNLVSSSWLASCQFVDRFSAACQAKNNK